MIQVKDLVLIATYNHPGKDWDVVLAPLTLHTDILINRNNYMEGSGDATIK